MKKKMGALQWYAANCYAGIGLTFEAFCERIEKYIGMPFEKYILEPVVAKLEDNYIKREDRKHEREIKKSELELKLTPIEKGEDYKAKNNGGDNCA